MAQERSWSERAKRGDTRAFTQIYRTFVRPLYSAVAPITRNPAAADDVLADTFRSAFEQMHTFDTNGRSIYFWLRKMAVNNAFMLSRKYKSGEKAFDGFGKLLDASDVPDLDRMIDWPKMQARVKTVLSQLSERHRRAIELRFFEELSSQVAGEALGISAGAFDVALSRALDAFAQIWNGGDR